MYGLESAASADPGSAEERRREASSMLSYFQPPAAGLFSCRMTDWIMIQKIKHLLEFGFTFFPDLQTQRAADWLVGAAGAGRPRRHSREPPPADETSTER